MMVPLRARASGWATLVGVGAMLLGCGGGDLPPAEAPPSPTATGNIVGLRIFVDPTITITSSDADCKPAIDSLPPNILQWHQQTLSNAGLVIIADPSAAHDVTLKIRGDFTRCGTAFVGAWRGAGLNYIFGTFSASLQANGQILAQASAGSPESFSRDYSSVHGEWGAHDIARDLLRSAALATFASSLKPAAAIAPAPAAAPAASPVAPATAGGCMKDNDCKGDRVCEHGACVSPR